MTSFTGGVRFGRLNATWPFGRLQINKDQLTVGAGMLGRYSFSPEQVVEVKAASALTPGVQIVHNRTDVPARVIFWTFRRAAVLEAIRAHRFMGTASVATLNTAQNQRGFPFRLPFLAAVVVLWNSLLLFDRPWESGQPGAGTVVALGSAFIVSLLVQKWTPMQHVALRSADALIRVQPMLRLIAMVAFAMDVLILTRLAFV